MVELLTVFGIIAGFGWLVWASFIKPWRLRRAADEDTEGLGPPEACEHCGYDLRGTPHRCPECGQPNDREQHRAVLRRLREDWPDTPIDPVPPAAGEPTVVLMSTQSGWDAELWEEQLNARGVHCVIQGHELRLVEGGFARSVIYHRLVVPQADRERAEAIMEWFRRPAADLRA